MSNLPKPIPVYIQSFTGFGLKLELVEFLYNAIIDIAYRKCNIEIDAIKIESYLDKVDVVVGHHVFRAKDTLPIYRFAYYEKSGRHGQGRAEDQLSHFAYGLVYNLKKAIEKRIEPEISNGKTQKEAL